MPNAARTDTEQLLSAVNGINAPFPVPYVRDRNSYGDNPLATNDRISGKRKAKCEKHRFILTFRHRGEASWVARFVKPVSYCLFSC
jgi:hypothetical protein